MIPDGWVVQPSRAFGTLVGPFYRPAGGDASLCGFVADERHGNKRGVVHGGMIATAMDTALGNRSWAAAGEKPCATVQLGIQYVGALKLGEFALIRSDLVRTTRSLVFVRATMTADDRMVATADGVWKILAWRGEAYRPPG